MSELIDPMLIEIQQKDLSSTPFPSGVTGRKFPIGKVTRNPTVELLAQVTYGLRDTKGHHTQLGTDEQRKGYIVLDYQELKDKNITLQRGDKITRMMTKKGILETELYLDHSTGDLAGHFDGEFGLVVHNFTDRDPVG